MPIEAYEINMGLALIRKIKAKKMQLRNPAFDENWQLNWWEAVETTIMDVLFLIVYLIILGLFALLKKIKKETLIE